MKHARIIFEPSGRNGVVACESYLLDAARRLGVEIDTVCGRRGDCDSCSVQVKEGVNLLSQPTDAEKRILGNEKIVSGVRLACQGKIEREGKLIAMTKETEKQKNSKETKDDERTREFKAEFDRLPLEKKIARLLDMELTTIGETFSFVVQSPLKIFDMGMNVLAEFGFRFDQEKKKAERPVEHQSEKSEEKSPLKNAREKKSKSSKKK